MYTRCELSPRAGVCSVALLALFSLLGCRSRPTEPSALDASGNYTGAAILAAGQCGVNSYGSTSYSMSWGVRRQGPDRYDVQDDQEVDYDVPANCSALACTLTGTRTTYAGENVTDYFNLSMTITADGRLSGSETVLRVCTYGGRSSCGDAAQCTLNFTLIGTRTGGLH